MLDVFRSWLLVKVYKMAYQKQMVKDRKLYVFALIFLQAKYKFASVVFNFNDTVMHLIALVSIYFHLRSKFWLAVFFMGFAASVKMSAFLFVPGCLLVTAFEWGILSALLYLVCFFLVQILFGLEFLIKNAKGYYLMAYDFDRKFAQSESINFQYFSEAFTFSRGFERTLLALHFGFLFIFLFLKWTGKETSKEASYLARLFREVRLWPLTFERRILNPYNTFLIIATSNFIGLAFSRGTHQ